MRVASNWQDYELIDTSSGEKLERWKNVTLIRPDPQIIWKTGRENPGWNRADAHYHRSRAGGGKWEYMHKLPQNWQISYKDLTFKISPTGFKHTGLFPEQAVNWDLFGNLIREAKEEGRNISVLNLFAYTGGATLACLKAGASVCHVDASKGMVQWAKENAALSHLENQPVRWIVDDCEKFIQREIRRGHTYDAIIMDPPSYGRGPGGEVWQLEEKIYDLLSLCCGVLSDRPLFVALNSYSTGLSGAVMAYLMGVTVGRERTGFVSADEIGLPVTEGGLVLPCGSTALWTEKDLSR
ncbi:MAG: class I SAM-dependent methyltransferase [Candidatus Faecivivens sp.]|nr:class I SAM-dependent methyltransferase [Oscillospiraceae bacterium]MDY2712827.1 class I SAM-dependent methyltransferase [Candidatus Faecivivens sp.]